VTEAMRDDPRPRFEHGQTSIASRAGAEHTVIGIAAPSADRSPICLGLTHRAKQ
jgi:hypothetical protein